METISSVPVKPVQSVFPQVGDYFYSPHYRGWFFIASITGDSASRCIHFKHIQGADIFQDALDYMEGRDLPFLFVKDMLGTSSLKYTDIIMKEADNG